MKSDVYSGGAGIPSCGSWILQTNNILLQQLLLLLYCSGSSACP